ncbi:class I SAM-dependent methyltransferase [Agrobacterium fabrum]|uniref:class I SAM-dependent methyltransferase n=1 Tax=Agrobacterium fabrum TaxID=1176649 RepID=UPI0021579480|nr:class I SAM-dependent methyltransferase [Agrobacterium fabrum]MCR6727794.1 class I SAM-dependent methyltransferase [Agrobacterium fabrum]
MSFLSGSLVDRIARRPSGLLGYLFYRFPLGHKPGFNLALDCVPPAKQDTILEVGCGGGVFLRRALESGCTAIAIDHSADMIANTARLNNGTIRQGRLTVYQADAARLPVADCSIDTVYCLNAFFFFPEPAASIAEMARVLKPGGTLCLITSPPEFRDQIAKFSRAMADSMRFDTPETLTGWTRQAGLEPIDTRQAANAGFLFIARKERNQ